MKALTLDEINRLLKSVTDRRLHCMILLAFRHGCRASEIVGLKWTDLDIAARTITIRRLKHSLVTVQALSDAELDALTEVAAISTGTSLVFPVHRATFHRWFAKAAKDVGIAADKCHVHTLKHALGYVLARAGTNMAVVQQALGHRSINSTAVYTRVTDEDAGQAVAQVLGG